MKHSRKLLLASVTLLVVVAVALGIFVQFSSRGALLRAEAFLFRRMQVARLDEDSYRFFYATNRAPGSRDGTLEGRFGNGREKGLRFGSFDAHIEPSLGLSAVFDPTKWFRNEEVDILREQALDREEITDQLRAMIEDSPRQSLLVIVHGYREQFPSALRKTAFISHVLDIDTPVLVFDWPGDQPGLPLVSYRRAGEIAGVSGSELAQTLEWIVDEVQPERLWLVANSMGAQVVADAFGLLYQDPDFADPEIEIEEVVLTAPDVGLDEFDDQFEREISALTRHLTVYVSSNDMALMMSRIVNRQRRRGESTLDSRNVGQDQLHEAVRLAALLEPGSDLVTLVDVTPVNRTINFHNFYLESPEVYNDLFRRLVNERPPQSRELYPVKTRNGSIYWILTSGR